jgi:nicotinic acid phosphoribosyltransferase
VDIKARTLKPTISIDDLDVYLPRGVAALKNNGNNPIGLFRIFQRHDGAAFFGLTEYLSALASLAGKEAGKITVWSVPEGYRLSKHQTALTLEGPAQSLMANETLLHFLSTGTRFKTLANDYPAKEFPWVFMGARYLSSEDLAIATRALSTEGILSTVPRWADKYIGTESHSQIVMWSGLRLSRKIEREIEKETKNPLVAATIRATIAFYQANPEVPLFVLGDIAARSVGCFEVFRATAAVCKRLGIPLVGGRMDISKADLEDVPIFDPVVYNLYREALAEADAKFKDGYWGDLDPGTELLAEQKEIRTKFCGMNPTVVSKTRKLLDANGLTDFKLVVSSGIKLEAIKSFQDSGANIIGIGEEAAYYLNKGQCNFTSDAIGYFAGESFVPFAKEGRELDRVIGKGAVSGLKRGQSINKELVRHNLADYL